MTAQPKSIFRAIGDLCVHIDESGGYIEVGSGNAVQTICLSFDDLLALQTFFTQTPGLKRFISAGWLAEQIAGEREAESVSSVERIAA